jgi:molybdopterin molybdotransferase
VATLTFEQARECVISKVSTARTTPPHEDLPLLEAAGRVLAQEITADRDYPPLARSVRDGFAVRSSELPGEFEIIGEVRAGDIFTARVEPGQAVEIMTGAPVPAGADCVVMVEQCRVTGSRVATDTVLATGANINPQAAEAPAGQIVIEPGRLLGYADIALLATVGRSHVRVYRRPSVAIIATGDEIVEVDDTPLEYQIRNSNAQSLAVQVARAGGIPGVLPVARDNYESTRQILEQGLQYDMLLLSGGVSAGKFDIVERVLAGLGAEFYFDRVLIQPGQPLVFGQVQGKFVFGLPGNPGSTMVTFEVFARAAVELLAGQREAALPLLWSKLTADFHARPGLRRFLPAQLSCDGGSITPLRWAGSGDVVALSRANAFVVTEPDRESFAAGEMIRVLQK